MTALRVGLGLAAVFTATAVLTAGVVLRVLAGLPDLDDESGTE